MIIFNVGIVIGIVSYSITTSHVTYINIIYYVCICIYTMCMIYNY